MDCGFYWASFWLTLGCMGLAAVVLEARAWWLGRRLGGRLWLTVRLDPAGLTERQRRRLERAARQLCRLRWPGAVILWQQGEEGDRGTTAGAED